MREGIHAGRNILSLASTITTPLLLLQAGEDRVVDNRSQDLFCAAMAQAGHPCETRVIKEARHEILFEKDAMRAEALNALVDFFEAHP